MSLHRTLLALAVASGLAVSVDASAQPFRHPGPHGLGQILASVSLTAAQKQQIHAIMSGTRTQDAAAAAQLRTLHNQLESTLFSSGDVTAARLAPIQQQIETLRAQLDASRLQAALAVRGLLTPAQLAKASSVQAQLASLHQQERSLLAPSRAQ